MKNISVALLLTSLTLPLAFDASAQQPAPAPSARRDTQRDAQRQAWQKPAEAVESNKLIGARVKGANGKDVGEIDGLIVSKDGKVTHVIVGKGGVAGIGETKVVVPWADVKVSSGRDRETPVITMDPAVLDRAPRYAPRAGADRDRTPAASPGTAPAPAERPAPTEKKY